jgi:hypothetical protein
MHIGKPLLVAQTEKRVRETRKMHILSVGGGGGEATKSVGFYLSVSIRFSPINYSIFVTYVYIHDVYRKYTDHIIWCLYK